MVRYQSAFANFGFVTGRKGAPACLAALSVLLWVCAASPSALRAQAIHHHYVAIDLGTLGGPDSNGCVPDCRSLNNLGDAAVIASTAAPDPFPNDPFSYGYVDLGVNWQNGVSITLNALQPGYSSFPFWLSDTGLVAGISENGKIDPTTGFPEAIATAWFFGLPINLGTLGGNASTAEAVNNAGQVVGGAANQTADPFAGPFYNVAPNPNIPNLDVLYYPSLYWPVTTETHAFLWQFGRMRDLGTLGGTDSLAVGINDAGQIIGYSFTNTTPNPMTGEPTLHPFLWNGGAMRDLGSLGGTMGMSTSINDYGHVTGWSNLAGDTAYHPFLWDGHGMTDLGTLGGDNGEAIWINNKGQIAGYAEVAGNATHHAFLWENGRMTDLGADPGDTCSTAYALNSLGQVVGFSGQSAGPGPLCGGHPFFWENGGPAVDPTTLYPPLPNGLTLGGLCCINDLGEMLGYGGLPNGGEHAMLIVPCDEHHLDVEGCDYSLTFGLATTPHDDAISPPTVPAGDSGKPLGRQRKRGVSQIR